MYPIEFVGFAGDCVVTGRVLLFADRLSDMLNHDEEFHVRDVLLDSLDDGHQVEIPEITVARSELFAVIGTGPRGIMERRQRTRPYRMQVSLGPYLVLGQLHTFPGADPLASVLRRSPMVPLTNATIAYTRAGEVCARDAATLVVNRELAEWIRPTRDEAIAFPDVPILEPARGPSLAKDFTGMGGP
jgi:hypothetical protein